MEKRKPIDYNFDMDGLPSVCCDTIVFFVSTLCLKARHRLSGVNKSNHHSFKLEELPAIEILDEIFNLFDSSSMLLPMSVSCIEIQFKCDLSVLDLVITGIDFVQPVTFNFKEAVMLSTIRQCMNRWNIQPDSPQMRLDSVNHILPDINVKLYFSDSAYVVGTETNDNEE